MVYSSETLQLGAAESAHQNGAVHEQEAHLDYLRTGLNPELNQIWNERGIHLGPEELKIKIYNSVNAEFGKIQARYAVEQIDPSSPHIPFLYTIDMDTLIEIRRHKLEGTAEQVSYASAFLESITDFNKHALSSNKIKGPNGEIDLKITDVTFMVNQFKSRDKYSDDELKDVMEWFRAEISDAEIFNHICVKPFKVMKVGDLYNLIDKAAEANYKVFRISSEWSWFLHSMSESNTVQANLMSNVINYIHKKGLKAVLCAQHFTFPVNIGEPHKKDFVENYKKYIINLLDHLASRDALPDELYLINEPMAELPQGYLAGEWPPFQKNPINFIRALNNTVSAYKQAYYAVKAIYPNLRVGFTENFPEFTPRNPNSPIDRFVSRTYTKINSWFFDRVMRDRMPADNIGMQNYGGHLVNLANPPASNPGLIENNDGKEETTANGWHFIPEILPAKIIDLYAKLLDMATEQDIVTVPSISLSEFGIAMLTNPSDRIELLIKGAELANDILPEGLSYALLWSIFKDTLEWREAYGMQSGFGVDTESGRPKPNHNRPKREFNYKDAQIAGAMEKLASAIDHRIIYFDKKRGVMNESERIYEINKLVTSKRKIIVYIDQYFAETRTEA